MAIRNKWLAGILAFVFIFSMAGCSDNKPDGSATGEKPAGTNAKQESIELEFWTINLKKNFEEYITKNLIAEYERTHANVKIKWVDVPGAEVTKKLITALSSDSVPDVVNETTSGISVLQKYGALLPLSNVIEPVKFEPYIDGLIDGVKYDGKIMALPWYTGGPPIQFINSEIYQKAGLDPNKPAKTFQELFDYARQIHRKFPEIYGSNDIPTLELMISEGLPILSEDRKQAVFNSPQHVAFVQMFVDAYKDGAIAPGAVVKDDRQLQQTIENGQTAHVGQGLPFQINNWKKNAPDILPKIVVQPAVTGKAGKLAIKDYQTFIVPKKSKHPREAAEFALFVTSHQKQLEFCKLVAIFPSTEETLKDEFFTNIQVTDLSSAARKMQVESASKLTLGKFGLDNEQAMIDNYLEQIRAALLGQKTVQQALDDAKKFWDQELKKQ